MSSKFVARLLAQVTENQEAQLQALDAAIASASEDPTLTDEDRLKSGQLLFALSVIAAVANGMAPWLASGPTAQDKDWATDYFKSNRAAKVRPAHFDPEIEELLQQVVP